MARRKGKIDYDTSSSINENSDSDLDKSNDHHDVQNNQKKYGQHRQKPQLPHTSYSSESLSSDSDDNDSQEKSHKFKIHATRSLDRYYEPAYHKKSKRRNSTKCSKYYHRQESDSGDMSEDTRSYQYNSEKANHKNSPLNSKSLINTLATCPRYRESLFNLADYEDILPKYVRKVVNSKPHIFTLSDNIVILNPKISICRQHLSQGCSKQSNCHDLHICQQFIINNCKDSKCLLGHNLTSNHNRNVLKQFKIHKLSTEILINILKTQTSPNKPLKVCNKYNLGRCKNFRCDSLHVCHELIQNNYRCKLNNCNLNHNILDDMCLELLADAGVPTNEAPRDVLAALLEINPSLCEISSVDNNQEESVENCDRHKKMNKILMNSQQNYDFNANSVNSAIPNNNLEKKTSNDFVKDSYQQELNENSGQANANKKIDNSLQNENTLAISVITELPTTSVIDNSLQNENNLANSVITELPNTSLIEASIDCLGNRDRQNESLDIPDSEREPFQWQVSDDGNHWVNMYHSQALRIEQSFCDPKNETITLSKLICPNIHSDRNDIDSLMGNHFWEANFQSMLLIKDDQSEILYLKRENINLQESESHKNIIFLWYFEDCDGKWLECGQDNDRENKLLISASSSEIEDAYLNDPHTPLTLGNQYVSFILDFDSMTLLNLQNNNKINVRRRPNPHLKTITQSVQGETNILFNMDHTKDNDVSEILGNNTQTSVRSQKHTVWTHNPEGYVEVSEICYDSVESICKNELSGCKRLHAKLHYHWQVSEDGSQWLNMHPSHVLSLERAFCNPVNDEMSIPRLDQPLLSNEESGSLIAMGIDTWKANFQSMLLLNKTLTRILYLRRLTTESIAGQCIEANSYLWYIKNKDGNWVKLEKDSINDFSIDISSAAIEGNFQQDSSSSMMLGNSSWILNFETNTLSNNESDIRYDVKRRPKTHLKVSEDMNLNEEQETEDQSQSLSNSISTISLPDTWDPMIPGEKSCRIRLSQLSTEFATVQDILPDSLQTKVANIERIQNPFLWYAFQNKVREMSTTYGDDESTVNIMQLFHGTKPDVISNICTENFDWRLHGSTTGQVYGRGAYFSTDGTISYRYCTSDSSGKHYLLLAQVAVGTITLGDSTMVRPPVNGETGLPYDSTVNNLSNPTIIVKYDKQEYFPEYIITIE